MTQVLGQTGERRIVTAIFADVVGSTTLMETIDPEDWTAIVNGAFEIMSRAVNRYGGTIAQLQGDALVAFFGAPVAHEDDAQRAVLAALDMISNIQGYREQLIADQGIDFQIRAGVNTGPVVVGTVGSDLHREYTALGDAMNVAARMESAARPGTVLLSHDTFRQVSGAFDVQDLGLFHLKGKSGTVRGYEIIGPRTTPGRDRGISGLRSPMVGRGDELATLQSALDAWKRGRGTVACLIGDAGLGKTRLSGEFKTLVLGQDERVTWAEGRSVSVGSDLPFHLVLDLVRSCLGVSPGSPDAETEQALAATLSTLPESDRSLAYPLLAHLLSLPVSESDRDLLDHLDPEVLQLRYVSGMKQLLSALSSAGPLVLLLEDVHWADEASVAVLRQVLAFGAPLRTFVLITTRPDRQAPGWQLVSLARAMLGESLIEIHLRPLSEEQSERLLRALLDVESLPPSLREKLLARADGNPFFLEELIKVLIDRGTLVKKGREWVATSPVTEGDVPDTLRSLLLSRIDRLPEKGQKTLKVASVIGRQFSVKVLDRVIKEPVQPHLDLLEQAGLIQIAAIEPERAYTFRHSLFSDAAYDSLLKRQRRQLHLQIAEATESLLTDFSGELAAELGLHYEKAGDDRAIPHLLEAAAHAQRRFAIHEARTAYERVLRFLEGRSEPSWTKVRVEATVGAAETGWTFSDADGEIEALEKISGPAEKLGDRHLLVRLYSSLAMLRQFQGEKYGVGSALTAAIDRANEISEELGDPGLRARPLAELGWAMAQAGDLRRGIELLEEAVPLLERSGKWIDLGLTLDGLAFEYTRLGDFQVADEWLARAEEVAEHGDPIAKLDLASIKGGIALFRFELDEAMDAARTCAARAEEMGALSCSIGSHLVMGMVNLIRGRPDLALPSLERGGELSLVSLKFWQPLIGAARATAEAMLGRMGEAVPRWQASLDRAREIGDPFVEASVLQMRATVAMNGPGPEWDWILPDLGRAVELFEHLGVRPFLARALRDLGMALEAAGRPDEARTALSRALDLFRSMGLIPEAGMLEPALGGL